MKFMMTFEDFRRPRLSAENTFLKASKLYSPKAKRVSAAIEKYLHQLHKQFHCGQFSEIFSRSFQDKRRKKKNSNAPQIQGMETLLIL
jgi:hypothetical protein